MQDVCFQIGVNELCFKLNGSIVYGADQVLIEQDNNLLAETPFDGDGYTIQPFLSREDFLQTKLGITELVKRVLLQCGITMLEKFSLEKYHNFVDDTTHSMVAHAIQKGWNIAYFPIDFSKVQNRVSAVLQQELTVEAKHVDATDFYSNKTLWHPIVAIFSLRIARPGKLTDNNPPHRDVWLDRLRNAVNIYVPLSGSTSNSSLALIPGSHYFNENRIGRTAGGALLNNIKYTVPCVVEIDAKKPVLTRANPAENEMLIFSPYLVHGGGYNLESDVTRVSLEVRFWKR